VWIHSSGDKIYLGESLRLSNPHMIENSGVMICARLVKTKKERTGRSLELYSVDSWRDDVVQASGL
jgi:hypothetical protein